MRRNVIHRRIDKVEDRLHKADNTMSSLLGDILYLAYAVDYKNSHPTKYCEERVEGLLKKIEDIEYYLDRSKYVLNNTKSRMKKKNIGIKTPEDI